MDQYNDGRRHVESSNISNEVTLPDTIYSDQIEVIYHPDEIVSFDSMRDAQIDMICHPDEVANFHSIPSSQNDFFFSPFFLFFQK